MYSDVTTDSMKKALEETDRRREIQRAYNVEHGITPQGVKKAIVDLSQYLYDASPGELPRAADGDDLLSPDELKALIAETEKRMVAHADEMEFEKAAAERDRLLVLREMDLGLKPPSRAAVDAPQAKQEQRPMGRKSQSRKSRRRR